MNALLGNIGNNGDRSDRAGKLIDSVPSADEVKKAEINHSGHRCGISESSAKHVFECAADTENGKIKKYVSDFPNPTTVGAKGWIVTPHLGASTAESEDNCAIMAVREIRDYMENGNIVHSVNFPDCSMGACTTAGRIGILHRNVSGMISQYSTTLGDAGMNIAGMTNKSKGEYAYVLIDVDSPVTDEVIEKLRKIEGVLRVRKVK